MDLLFFRVKTKLEIQIEEYIQYKRKKSVYTAERHEKILLELKDFLKCKDVSEIRLLELDDFHKKILFETSPYGGVWVMESIRGFIAFYWHTKQTHIDPKLLTNKGVISDLPSVEDNDTIPPMMKRGRGRPLHIELIKKVKRLRDNEGLQFRQIGKAIGKDVSQVHGWYKKELPSDVLNK